MSAWTRKQDDPCLWKSGVLCRRRCRSTFRHSRSRCSSLKVRSRSLRLGWGKTPRTPPDLLLQIPRGKKAPGSGTTRSQREGERVPVAPQALPDLRPKEPSKTAARGAQAILRTEAAIGGHPTYRSLPPEPPGGLPAAEGPLASRDQPGRTVLPGGSYRRSSGPGNGRGSPGDPGSGGGDPQG